MANSNVNALKTNYRKVWCKSLGGLIALLALTVLISGCVGWRVVPPANLDAPASVYITRYGRHTRLALPMENHHHGVEYGFGDWNWYALQDTNASSGLRALFLVTDSALSRRILLWQESAEAFQGESGGSLTLKVEVESSLAEALLAKLEERWQSLRHAEEVTHFNRDIVYRKTDEPYHVLNNSNAKAVEWLRELGCRVYGIPLDANFKVMAAEP